VKQPSYVSLVVAPYCCAFNVVHAHTVAAL
jgi:hypothetical protein